MENFTIILSGTEEFEKFPHGVLDNSTYYYITVKLVDYEQVHAVENYNYYGDKKLEIRTKQDLIDCIDENYKPGLNLSDENYIDNIGYRELMGMISEWVWCLEPTEEEKMKGSTEYRSLQNA